MSAPPPWSGRRVARLVAQVLEAKGTVCWLCGMDGADSADHDPPRSHLIKAGVPDPDAMIYLHPAHRVPCNVGRGRRQVTDRLKAWCRAARLAHVQRADAAAALSPRFAHRRDVTSF